MKVQKRQGQPGRSVTRRKSGDPAKSFILVTACTCAAVVLAAGGSYTTLEVAAGQTIHQGNYFTMQKPLYPSATLYPRTTLYPSAGDGDTIYPWSSGTPSGIALEDGVGGETISVYLMG